MLHAQVRVSERIGPLFSLWTALPSWKGGKEMKGGKEEEKNNDDERNHKKE